LKSEPLCLLFLSIQIFFFERGYSSSFIVLRLVEHASSLILLAFYIGALPHFDLKHALNILPEEGGSKDSFCRVR